MADHQTEYYQVSYDKADSILVQRWGGTGGSKWTYKFENPIKEIMIAYGEIIDSIQFRTIDKDGSCTDSPMFGGTGGDKNVKVEFKNAPLEYLTGISGTLGHFVGGHLFVKSLYFTTNLVSYGPFGAKDGGTPFSFLMKGGGGAIVGFHGRSGPYLDAIGIYLQQATPFVQVNNDVLKQQKFETIEFHDKMDVMKTILPRSPGPWGGCGGKPWDDGVCSAIKQIVVIVNSYNSLCGLHIEYEKDGISFMSEHGGHGEWNSTKQINLAENEFLIGIEGFFSPMVVPVQGVDFGGLDAIRQITFYTNKEKYGPYGFEVGTYFSSSAARGRIVGFHGRSGLYVNAIGVHMQYF